MNNTQTYTNESPEVVNCLKWLGDMFDLSSQYNTVMECISNICNGQFDGWIWHGEGNNGKSSFRKFLMNHICPNARMSTAYMNDLPSGIYFIEEPEDDFDFEHVATTQRIYITNRIPQCIPSNFKILRFKKIQAIDRHFNANQYADAFRWLYQQYTNNIHQLHNNSPLLTALLEEIGSDV